LLAGGGSGDDGSSSSGICNGSVFGSVLGMVIAVGSAVVLVRLLAADWSGIAGRSRSASVVQSTSPRPAARDPHLHFSALLRKLSAAKNA